MGKLSNLLGKALDFLVPTKTKPTFTSAVIVAGGSSTRMGNGISKQFLELSGIPVVVRTLLAFENTQEIDEIIVVAKKEEIELYNGFKSMYGLTKLKKAVVGGSTRKESAENGFLSISPKSNFVAIHDGARCLITPEEISRVCHEAYKHGAATAASRAIDTIKIAAADGFIEKTVDRDSVWHAQTPQIFGADLYRAALAVAEQDGISVTDDCSLVEHINHKIKLVECSRSNIKITTQGDFHHAKAIIRAREKKLKKAAK